MPKFLKKPKIYIPTIIVVVALAFLGVFVFFQRENRAASEWEKMLAPTDFESGVTLRKVFSVFSQADKQYYAWAVGTKSNKGVLFYYTGSVWKGLIIEGDPNAQAPHGFTIKDLSGVTAILDGSSYKVWMVGNSVNGKEVFCYSESFIPSNPTNPGTIICDEKQTGSNKLNSVFAYDKKTIYAVGDGGNIYYSDTDEYYDSDHNNCDPINRKLYFEECWHPKTSGTNRNLNSINLVASSADANGWIVGDRGIIFKNPTAQNGGGTWSSVSSNTSEHLYSVSFADATHGWASGGISAPELLYYDGSVWTSIKNKVNSSPNGAGLTKPINGLSAIYDTDLHRYYVWAAASGGAIAHFGSVNSTVTSDQIWLQQNTNLTTSDFLYGVHAANNTHAWAVGIDNTNASIILKLSPGNITGWGKIGADNCQDFCLETSAGSCRAAGCSQLVDPQTERTSPLGWLSLNCANTATCNNTTFSYGMNIKKQKGNVNDYDCTTGEDTDVGALSGYAWLGVTDPEQKDLTATCDLADTCLASHFCNVHSAITCTSDSDCHVCSNNSDKKCASLDDCQICSNNSLSCRPVGWMSFDRNEIGTPPDSPYNTTTFQTPCGKTIDTTNPPFNYITATFDYATRKIDGWARIKLGQCNLSTKACFTSTDCPTGETCSLAANEGWVKFRKEGTVPGTPGKYTPCYGCITKSGTKGDYLECAICSRNDWSCNRSLKILAADSYNCGEGRCSLDTTKTCKMADICVLKDKGQCSWNGTAYKCTDDPSLDCIQDSCARRTVGLCYYSGICSDNPNNICLSNDLVTFSGCGLGASCNYLGSNTCNAMDSCNQYGVSLDLDAGEFYGYAWSSELGWISFNGANLYNFAWIQEKYSDIYSQANIGGFLTGQAPGATSLAPGRCNATYMIQADGSIKNFCSSGKSQPVSPATAAPITGKSEWITPDWSGRGYGYVGFPKSSQGYTNVFGKLDYTGITTIVAGGKNKYGVVVEVINNNGDLNRFLNKFKQSNGGGLLDGKIYYIRNLSLNVNALLQFNNGSGTESGAGLIVIEGGNLVIPNNIDYQGVSGLTNIKQLASVGFIVTKDANGNGGNITIENNVTNIVGNYFAEGTVTVKAKSQGYDSQLKVAGLMIASQFDFQRKYKGTIDNPQPSEQVIYDGRLIANPPPGFKDLASLLPIIREVSP